MANLDHVLTAVKAKGILRPTYVFSWIPAASIYFEDPDGHSLEFLAKLPGDPQPSLGIVPLSKWPGTSRRSLPPVGRRGSRF